MNPLIMKALDRLGLTGYTDHPPKMKVITKCYHQLSMKHHPDRPGGVTSVFQEISNAFKLLGEFIEENYEPSKDDFEEDIARTAFRQFNFTDIKENLSSFTIKIENHQSLEWDVVLTKHYGVPVDRKQNGKHWKHLDYSDDGYNSGAVTIGKWHIPKKDKQSKLHVQSNGSGNFLASHFVSFHLPKLLGEVSEIIKDKKSQMKQLSSNPQHTKEPKHNCKQCDYKSVSLSLLNTHMKSKHRNLKNESSTPIKSYQTSPTITKPLALHALMAESSSNTSHSLQSPASMVKPSPTITIGLPLQVATAADPEYFKCFICPNAYYATGEWDAHERSAHAYKCEVCQIIFPVLSEFDDHNKNIHTNVEENISELELTAIDSIVNPTCSKCSMTFPTDSSLNEHIESSHTVPTNQPCNIKELGETNEDELAKIPSVESYDTHVKQNIDFLTAQESQVTKTLLCCKYCDYSSYYNKKIKKHCDKKHKNKTNPHTQVIYCDLCDYKSIDPSDLSNHKETHIRNKNPKVTLEKLKTFKCPQCMFMTMNTDTLAAHIEESHKIIEKIFKCELCPFITSLHIKLKKHVATTHAKLRCDKCSYTSKSEFSLLVHTQHDHPPETPVQESLFPCNVCGITFAHQSDLNTHVGRNHEQTQNNYILNNHKLAMILEEQIDLAQSLKSFKETIVTQLTEIAANQNTLRNDIQQLSCTSLHTRSSLALMESRQFNIQNQLTSGFSTLSPEHFSPPITPVSSPSTDSPQPSGMPNTKTTSSPTNPPTASSTTVPGSPFILPTSPSSDSSSSPQPSETLPGPPFKPPPETADQSLSNSELPTVPLPKPSGQPSSKRLPTSDRSKVLFITDSIGRNVNTRHLEEATNTLIYSEEAYGAEFRTDALKPNKNFMYAAKNAPRKRDYKYAVLQGSSTDITNLDSRSPPSASIKFMEQEVFVASQNMVAAANTIIKNNPNIEKVILLETTPRFDIESVDPTGIKPELSKYSNKVMREEVKKSEFKDKIVIGTHTLPSICNNNIYGHPEVRGYDGIHMYGQEGMKYYTHSLCGILQKNLSNKSREPHNHQLPRYLLQTENLFPKHKPTPRPSNNTKPDHVIIEIDPPTEPYPHHNLYEDQYNIPVNNMFNSLGN